MNPKIQEPAYNTYLSELLKVKLPGWPQITPEVTQVFTNLAQAPDVLAEAPGGLPVVLECKFDKQANIVAVEQAAENRLGEQTDSGREVEQAVAVLYPEKHLRQHPEDARGALETATLKYAVYSTSGSGVSQRFPSAGWLEGSVGDLADLVENVAVSEQQMGKALDIFEKAIEDAQKKVAKGPAATNIADGLGVVLNQEAGEQTTRMAMAILLNALVFQNTVAGHYPEKIKSVEQMADDNGGMLVPSDVMGQWREILKINYWPIFAIAKEILHSVSSSPPLASSVLNLLSRSVMGLPQVTAQTVQDLAGQIFGRLISDRKLLATFYTLPSSATLLAELAVDRMDVDWSDIDAVKQLKIADFACGTGALLSAAYRQASQRSRRTGIGTADQKKLHKAMMEDVLIGTDIMPAAVHITAAMLSSVHPDVIYGKTQTHVMPYGKQADNSFKVGSLELLGKDEAVTLFGDGSRVTSEGEEERSSVAAKDGTLDLVIMNPPFTRTTGESRSDDVPLPAFAGFGNDEDNQVAMKNALNKIYKKIPKPKAKHGNATVLATSFIDLAIAKLKPGGVMAFVIPATFAAGAGWANAREVIARKCCDVCVVSIAASKAQTSSFSADTSLAEVLVVATRREEDVDDDRHQSEDWRWVTLEARPKLPVESVEVAKAALRTEEASFRLGRSKAGIKNDLGYGSSLEQIGNLTLIDVAVEMDRKRTAEFAMPQSGEVASVRLCPLDDIGYLGPLMRDIAGINRDETYRGPFDRNENPSGKVHYPIHWEHLGERDKKLLVVPDSEGEVRDEMEQKAVDVWQKSARLLCPGLFSMASQRLGAAITQNRCLGKGDTWFSLMLCEKPGSQKQEKMEWVYPVLLWCNTTLGLLSRWMHGTKQQGARCFITKTRLLSWQVLDPRELTAEQLDEAEKIYEDFKDKDFLPANEAYRDDTRIALDEAVLVRLLRQPEEVTDWLDVIRDQWCREPTVHGGKKTRP